jgi:hypothetical protein
MRMNAGDVDGYAMLFYAMLRYAIDAFEVRRKKLNYICVPCLSIRQLGENLLNGFVLNLIMEAFIDRLCRLVGRVLGYRS